jgi:hypothetical protein
MQPIKHEYTTVKIFIPVCAAAATMSPGKTRVGTGFRSVIDTDGEAGADDHDDDRSTPQCLRALMRETSGTYVIFDLGGHVNCSYTVRTVRTVKHWWP